MDYILVDGTLYHHGTRGMKWGQRNYQNEDGSYTAAGQAENNGHGRYSSVSDSKSKFKLTDKQKKYIKIGLAIAGTALVAYGGYSLLKSEALNKYIKSGKNYILNVKGGNSNEFISEKARAIAEQTSLDVKQTFTSANEDIEILRNSRIPGDPRYENDCGVLAMNFVLRRLGLDVTSVGMDKSQLGGLSLSEIGHYFKGIAKRIELVSMSNNKSQSDYLSDIKNVIEKQCGSDSECSGLIHLVNNTGGAHYTTWYKENGSIIFDDIQFGNSDFINKVNLAGLYSIGVARMDDLEIKARNLLGSSIDTDIKAITKNR